MSENIIKFTTGYGSQSERYLKEAADREQFSNFIGENWEKVAERNLQELSANPEEVIDKLQLNDVDGVGAIVPLDTDPKIKKEAKELKIPDAVILGTIKDGSLVVLRAVDFKFNLARAVYHQVHPKTLFGLLQRSPSAKQSLGNAFEKLHISGKLDKGIVMPEKFPEDQNNPGYIVLDEAQKIRLATGKFISPDTNENRQYFEAIDKTGRIRKQNVHIVEMSFNDAKEFLRNAPGKEFADMVKNLPVDSSLPIFDQMLIKARAAAAVKGYKLASIDQLYNLVSGTDGKK